MNRLEDVLGKPVPVTLVFDHPTVSAIADYLIEEYQPQGSVKNDAILRTDNARQEHIAAICDIQLIKAGDSWAAPSKETMPIDGISTIPYSRWDHK